MSNAAEKEFILDDTDRLMAVSEVAERLRASPEFVRKLIEMKLLVAYTFQRNIKRIRKNTFNEFLQKYDGENLPEILENHKNICQSNEIKGV